MENGFAIAIVSTLSEKLKLFYRESFLSRLILSIGFNTKRLFTYSRIWKFITRPERTTQMFRESFTGRFIEKSADLFVNIFKLLGSSINASISGRIISYFVKSPVLVLGAFVFIQTIVPHHFWYNWLNLALSFTVLILYLIKCATDKDFKLAPLRIDFTVLLFIIISTVSALASIEVMDSIRIFILNMIPMAIVLVMVNAIKTKKDIDLFTWMLIAGVTVACVYGFWQYAAGIEVDVRLVDTEVSGSISRLFSTMGNPNNYAEYLVLCIPLYAAMFFNVKTIRTKLFVAGLFLLPSGNLLLTSSRSSWLGLVVAAFIFIFLTYRKVLPLMILAGIAMIPFLPDSIMHRITTIGRDSSSKYRLIIWKGSLNMLKDYWLTGTGQGPAPFMSLFPRYSYLTGVVHSHMLPLQIWLETGIAGLISFVWMLVRFFKKTALYSFGSGRKDTYLSNINAAAISGIAGLVFIGLFEYVWFYPRVMSIFWIITGLLMSSLRIGAKNEDIVTAPDV